MNFNPSLPNARQGLLSLAIAPKSVELVKRRGGNIGSEGNLPAQAPRSLWHPGEENLDQDSPAEFLELIKILKIYILGFLC